MEHRTARKCQARLHQVVSIVEHARRALSPTTEIPESGVIMRVIDNRADWIDIERSEEAAQLYASSAKDGFPSCEGV